MGSGMGLIMNEETGIDDQRERTGKLAGGTCSTCSEEFGEDATSMGWKLKEGQWVHHCDECGGNDDL